MDNLTELLSGSFSVTTAPNQTAAAHPRFAQYKQKSRGPSQDERRSKLLQMQKENRFDYKNFARRLAEGELSDGQSDEEDEMEWTQIRRPQTRSYKDQLMYSEWLVDVPPDLREEWYLVPCPVGKRSLVVVRGGNTKVYAKNGYMVNQFPSAFPGGSRASRDAGDFSKYTILDCIYNEAQKTFYILDLMCWNGHPIYDSETEFRFYWLQSKLSEHPEVAQIATKNRFSFKALPNYACTEESIRSVVHSPLPFEAPLDGLLFYHKRTHYTAGQTPLVGWLMIYMIPEMLGIPIADEYTQSRPSNYQGMKPHIEEYEKERKEIIEKRKSRSPRQKKDDKMDSAPIKEEVTKNGCASMDSEKSEEMVADNAG